MESDARSPTDEESAPLLARSNDGQQTFLAYFNALTQEPLTLLAKVLLGVILFLLMLSSIFIGLFLGVEHRLSSGAPSSGGENTVTLTTTSVSTAPGHSTTITVPLPEPTADPRERPCAKPECIILSASILKSIDVSQDPCENFYNFAIGGWLKSHPLPADKGLFGTFQEAQVENQRVIRSILSQNISSYPSADAKMLTKLQDLYQSCLHVDSTSGIGIKPLIDVINTVKRLVNRSSTAIDSLSSVQRPFGIKSKNGFTAAVAYLHSRSIEALFSFDIGGDVGTDPKHMTLWFNQPDLGLPSKEYFEEESTLSLYTSTITGIFQALDKDNDKQERFSRRQLWPPFPWPPWGDDKSPEEERKTPEELAEAVVQFEREIARAGLDLDKLEQDPVGTYNPMSFSNFSAALPNIDFPAYLSTYAPRIFPERIIVKYPTYISSLSSFLTNTSLDVLEGYLVVRASLSLADHLGSDTEIWKLKRALDRHLKGIKNDAVEDRAEYCTGKVEEAFGFAIGRFFAMQAFSNGSQTKATQAIKAIVKTFKKSLIKLSWMDEVSAKAAARKASAIRIKVGFPLSPNTTDAHAIARYYSGVEAKKDDFFGNMLRASVHKEMLKWAALGKQRDDEAWEMNPSDVNAYYEPSANEVVIPAGIIRQPFFSHHWPNYLNYGAFGHVTAHELTHAFDSAGRLYDAEGKLREWWTNGTSEAFEERRSCISRQYSKYTIDDGNGGNISVNGNLTSGENIGDTGLIQAYRAWKTQYETSLNEGSEYILPGLNYTREQLFFISFARIWAQNIRPQTAVQRVRTDPHSPNKYRVEGTLTNMDSRTFAAAFNCPKGSKLNPPEEQKCKLWQ